MTSGDVTENIEMKETSILQNSIPRLKYYRERKEKSDVLLTESSERRGRSMDSDFSRFSSTSSFSFSQSVDGDLSINESLTLGSVSSKRQFITRAESSASENSSFRATRKTYRKNRVGPTGPIRSNTVMLHIYDLIANDTLVELPWGCVFELGKCFSGMNSALHELGTGAYHVGVEINGIEYAYGSTDIPGRTGVFSCKPKQSPGYQYRTTIDFGQRTVTKRKWKRVPRPDKSGDDRIEVEKYIDGRQVIKEMLPEYMGIDYNLLRKNCCTFARDVCLRMNVPEEEIPSWFRNLAESGAMTQDLAYATVQPLHMVMSNCEEDLNQATFDEDIRDFEATTDASQNSTQPLITVSN